MMIIMKILILSVLLVETFCSEKTKSEKCPDNFSIADAGKDKYLYPQRCVDGAEKRTTFKESSCPMKDSKTCIDVELEPISEILYLTPLIKNGNIERAQHLARVYLDGADNITSYSGLFTVNESYQSNLFHWYFVAENEPETSPVLLWLNGGPGATSFYGTFLENGPFWITNDMKLRFREYYWTKNHHVIYIDSPVQTGYSCTECEDGMSKNILEIAENLHEALLQFFTMFPNLKNNDFFVTGESFAGKYIPALGHVIRVKNQLHNFKGVAIGNGYTDIVQSFGVGEYLYQQGFINDQQLELFHKQEDECKLTYGSVTLGNGTDLKACENIIDPYNRYSLFGNTTGYVCNFNILESNSCFEQDVIYEQFLNLPETRSALHVGNLKRWNVAPYVRAQLGISLLLSEKMHVEELLNYDYPVLIYSGQLDIQVPYITTVNYLKTLNFSHIEEYKKAPRQIWMEDGSIVGYIKKAGSLTDVMLIGAGHMVPKDQPKSAFQLITNFTRYRLGD